MYKDIIATIGTLLTLVYSVTKAVKESFVMLIT
jgi:hypothetical protein